LKWSDSFRPPRERMNGSSALTRVNRTDTTPQQFSV
jgi:hypothetical protein